VPLLTIGRSEATNLTFPHGHPRDQTLYTGDPVVPERYYPTAHFHRLAFQHKFSEAVRILATLGATQMRVEHEEGWSREFAAKVGLPVPTTQVEVGAEGGSTKNSCAEILFEATLQGTESPSLPTDLAWYPHEVAWQHITELRRYRTS
jgi:hypothetical protein